MLRSRVALILPLFTTFAVSLFSQENPRWEALLEQAGVQSEAGDFARAEQTYQTLLSEEQTSDMQIGLYLAAESLDRLYRAQNRPADIEAMYRRVLASQERRFGPLDARIGTWLMKLGRVVMERAEFDEAERLGLRAVAVYEAQPMRQFANTQAALRFLAELYRARGLDDEAAVATRRLVESAQEAVRDAIVRFGEGHPGVAGSITALAQAYTEAGQHEEAERELQRALDLYESSIAAYPELAISFSAALQQMARLQNALGRGEASRQAQARAEYLRAGAMHYERSPASR